MAGRMTVCNMTIEGGARAGMVAPDEVTFEYVRGRPFAPKGEDFDRAVAYWRTLPSDPGAQYDTTVTLDASKELAVSLLAKGAAIQAMIEPSAVSFFAPVSRKAYLTALSDGTTRFHCIPRFLLLTRSSGMYRLSSTAPPAVPSVHEVDIREEDLLRYTNAGGHVGYAIFLMDLAAAAGALSVFVVCDKYFQV